MNIRELAELAGLSKSTVAYALKDDPRIKLEVRERVQALAEAYGYRPSPVVNSLMREVRRGRQQKHSANLAYIMSGAEKDIRKRPKYEREMIAGAIDQADKLGYALEVIAWEADNFTDQRLNQVLKARGIRGIFVGPSKAPHAQMKLDWPNFYTLVSGYTMTQPMLDRIAAELYQSITDCIELIFARGYTKVALAIHDWTDKRAGYRWRSGVLVLKEVYGANRILLLSGDWANPSKEHLDQLKAMRGGAVIGHGIVYERLCELGIEMPKDLGFVAMDNLSLPKQLTALAQPHRLLGEKAVHHISSMVERGQFGIPTLPMFLTLACLWHEGETLPAT